jgi:AcrR family transcriptional regulator
MSINVREAILAAATETFARFGFKKTSIDDVARRSGIGKGTLYLHFESKEELFGAVLRRIGVKALAELDAAVRQARTPQAKVRAFLEGRERLYLQLAAELRISHESLVELLAYAEPHALEHVTRHAEPLAAILEEGNAQGVFAVPRPRLLATGMSACLLAMDGSLVGPGALDLQAALAELYDVLARGLLAQGGVARGGNGASAPLRRGPTETGARDEGSEPSSPLRASGTWEPPGDVDEGA